MSPDGPVGKGGPVGSGGPTSGDSGGGQLAGKVVAVTGATSGSGLAIARRFAAEGAEVVLLARGADRLKALEEELAPRAVGLPTDVGDPDSVREAFAAIDTRFGKLDILINNAGLHRPCPFESVTDADILTQVRCNLLGPVYTCRAAIGLLRAAGGGDIINTSSEVTLEVFPYESVYKATKAGLEALGQALGLEFEKEEIRVTTLIQGVALGEGGGSTDWKDNGEHTHLVWPRLQAEGTVNRVIGKHGGMTVEVDGFPVAVANVDGEYYAFQNLCPHQGSTLGGRSLEEGCFVVCPTHASRYDVRTGTCVRPSSSDGFNQDLMVFPTRVEDEVVQVRI